MGGRTTFAVVLALAAAVGCKDEHHFTDAAPPIDAPIVDGSGGIDAGIDAGPIDAAPSPPGQQLTTGGGRLSSPSFVLDVQVGHGVVQSPVQSASFRIEGNAPVKP